MVRGQNSLNCDRQRLLPNWQRADPIERTLTRCERRLALHTDWASAILAFNAPAAESRMRDQRSRVRRVTAISGYDFFSSVSGLPKLGCAYAPIDRECGLALLQRVVWQKLHVLAPLGLCVDVAIARPSRRLCRQVIRGLGNWLAFS
jgi:hypothetical protein